MYFLGFSRYIHNVSFPHVIPVKERTDFIHIKQENLVALGRLAHLNCAVCSQNEHTATEVFQSCFIHMKTVYVLKIKNEGQYEAK